MKPTIDELIGFMNDRLKTKLKPNTIYKIKSTNIFTLHIYQIDDVQNSDPIFGIIKDDVIYIVYVTADMDINIQDNVIICNNLFAINLDNMEIIQ